MRIALVGPNYFLDRSYQENLWAEQLVKAGHVVRVIAAGRETGPLQRIEGPTGTYELLRVKTRTLPRAVYYTRHSAAAVRAFKPDLIVVFGDKLFALGVARDSQLRDVPVISTYSENLGMHEFDWRRAGISLYQRYRALGFTLLRTGPIRALGRRSVILVGNTPQARDIIVRLFPKRERESIERKVIDMPLGFSPDHYGHNQALRRRVRAELGLHERHIVICTSSRFDPIKAPSIRLVIDAARQVMSGHAEVRALLIGFSEGPVSEQIRASVRAGAHADRFILHGFADRTRLNELFNASDIVAYNLATISCQEALGTGLYACFADIGAMHHLLRDPDQGALYRPNDADDLAAKLGAGAGLWERAMHSGQQEALRTRLADASRWLGYDRLIASLLARLEDH